MTIITRLFVIGCLSLSFMQLQAQKLSVRTGVALAFDNNLNVPGLLTHVTVARQIVGPLEGWFHFGALTMFGKNDLNYAYTQLNSSPYTFGDLGIGCRILGTKWVIWKIDAGFGGRLGNQAYTYYDDGKLTLVEQGINSIGGTFSSHLDIRLTNRLSLGLDAISQHYWSLFETTGTGVSMVFKFD
jgi:hypothetical protein